MSRLKSEIRANETYRALAVAAKEAGDYITAAKFYRSAAAHTIGHGKSARYEDAMQDCLNKAGASKTGGFAEQEDIDKYWNAAFPNR